ncbi:hypothetical protein BJ742DRAFT_854611 [Cladochytrium replicatum]|nr:hypothetical protein BJ742DRAFT_854611 [Cladochytrium replicatum]
MAYGGWPVLWTIACCIHASTASLFPSADTFANLNVANQESLSSSIENAAIVPKIQSVSSPFRLGYSYDSFRNSQLPRCLKLPVKVEDLSAGSSAVVEISKDLSVKEAGFLLSLDLSVSGLYAIFVITAGAGITTSAVSSKTSLNFVYKSTVKVYSNTVDTSSMDADNPSLYTAVGLQAKTSSDPNAWQNTCGNSFISEEQYGGSLIAILRIDFSNTDDLFGFRASIGLGVAILEIGVFIKTYFETIRRNVRVKVVLHQIGGDPTRLSDAVNGNTIASCDSSSGIELCLKILQSIVEYGQGTFAETVAEKPALIGFRTTSYDILGLKIPPLPIIEDRLRVARQYIEDEVDRSIETIARIDTFVGAGFVTPSRSAAFSTWRDFILKNNIPILGNALERCFTNLIVTNSTSVQNCITYYDQIIQPSRVLLEYPPEALFDTVVLATIADRALELNTTTKNTDVKIPGAPIGILSEIPGTSYVSSAGGTTTPSDPEERAYFQQYSNGTMFYSYPLGASFLPNGPLLSRYNQAILTPLSSSPLDSYSIRVGFPNPEGVQTLADSAYQFALLENPIAGGVTSPTADAPVKLNAQGVLFWNGKEGDTALLLEDVCAREFLTWTGGSSNLDDWRQFLGTPISELEEAYDGRNGKFCLFDNGIIYFEDIADRSAVARNAISSIALYGPTFQFWKSIFPPLPASLQMNNLPALASNISTLLSANARLPIFRSPIGSPLVATTPWVSLSSSTLLGYVTVFTGGLIFDPSGLKLDNSKLNHPFVGTFDIAAAKSNPKKWCYLSSGTSRDVVIGNVTYTEGSQVTTLSFGNSCVVKLSASDIDVDNNF